MMERRLKRSLILLGMVCLVLLLGAAVAQADDSEDAAEMAAYWSIVGAEHQGEPLARAMDGDYANLPAEEASAALAELKAVTAEELLDFAAAYQLPVSMARCAWYSALADCLTAELSQRAPTPTEERLSLFLAMKENPRDSAARQERKAIRKALTEADIHAYAAETGLPGGFLAWLLLDDEWYELDWEDGDDWREGRRDWDIPDWVDAADLRARHGKEAVVTEDDVERTLRQNGIWIDD